MPTSLMERLVTLNPKLVMSVPVVLASSVSRQPRTQLENPAGVNVGRSIAPAIFPWKLRSYSSLAIARAPSTNTYESLPLGPSTSLVSGRPAL